MADNPEYLKQYSYKSNAGLVLNLVDRGMRRRQAQEPTGEAESLANQAGVADLRKMMGSRAAHEKPTQESTESQKKSRRTKGKDKDSSSLFSMSQYYQPQTSETKQAYDVLLNLLASSLPGQPHDVLCAAADEILAIVHNRDMSATVKRERAQELLNSSTGKSLTDVAFGHLVNVAEKLTDFRSITAMENEPLKEGQEEEEAMPVSFDREEEDELDAMFDDEDEDEHDADFLDGSTACDASEAIRTTYDASEEDGKKDEGFNPHEIDAYWLQRKISKCFRDPNECQMKAIEILQLLSQEDKNSRQIENSLIELLGLDHFDLVKYFLLYRFEILYCTRLARASSTESRKQIEDEMYSRPEMRTILKLLKSRESGISSRETNLETALSSLPEKAQVDDRETVGKSHSVWVSSCRPSRVLDFDEYIFEAGGHLMSNDEWSLPPESWKKDYKDYQEVYVPARSTSQQDIELVAISSLPEWAHPPFQGYKTLNPVQSTIYRAAMLSAENLLLCAPTGSGKTNVAVLTILREIGLRRLDDTSIDLDKFKVVYIAPMKSLVREMVGTFTKRLNGYGVQVRELSGDQQVAKQDIMDSQVLVCTPEKWDIITRKSGYRTIVGLVSLVVIDEIHLLHDGRGPVLESIVARTLREIEHSREHTRLVGLSATLPNYGDVATLLRVDPESGLFVFDNSFRPCPLQQTFIGVTATSPFKQYQILNQLCFEKVAEQAGKNQVLVFVHSRKDTAATARFLREQAMEQDVMESFVKENSASRVILREESERVKSSDLKELLAYGFAIHHAGLSKSDRSLVEDLFAEGHLQVLVTTATLAWGVNLPAHCVLIKGTQVYSPEKGVWSELSMLDVMQMLGRAGRPQYDTFGEGIILTTQKELKYYLSLLNEQLPVESQLISSLVDILNAEVVLGSVRTIPEAAEWLSYTYYFVRMLRNPQFYSVPLDEIEHDPVLEQRRVDLAHSAAIRLDRTGLINYDRANGTLVPTDLGRIASHFYLTSTTMQKYHEHLSRNVSDIELLRVFSVSSEFQHVSVRQEEKTELAELLDRCPIPVKEAIDEPSAKINILLQAYIGRLDLDGYALLSDMVYVTQSGGRLMRAIFEIVRARGWAQTALMALRFCHMIEHRQWVIESPLRQFSLTSRSLPDEIVRKLEKANLPWEALLELEAPKLGELVRVPRLSRKLHRLVSSIPRLDLQAHVQPLTHTLLRVELTLTPDFAYDRELHGNAVLFWILFQDCDGEELLYSETLLIREQQSQNEHFISATIPIQQPLPPHYFVRAFADRWIGSETVLALSFAHLVLPAKFAPPMALLDLEAIPLYELGESASLYSNEWFQYMNGIQTQSFSSLYSSDSNSVLTAPTGSGKMLCAELAILHMLENNSDGRCVYIAARKEMAELTRLRWAERFESLGSMIGVLKGDVQTDMRELSTHQIVIALPSQWDQVSRRWKKRKIIQQIDLFIVDDIHLLGSSEAEGGPATLEVVITRMRRIQKECDSAGRMVLLGASVANAQEIATWIGAPSSNRFLFGPSTRVSSIELAIHAINRDDFSSRIAYSYRPSYQTISEMLDSSNNLTETQVIVFVPSRQYARQVAKEYIAFASAEQPVRLFTQLDKEALYPYLKDIDDVHLHDCLNTGIGYLHSGLSSTNQRIVRELFAAKAISVMIIDHTMCWALDLQANLVVVLGAEAYDEVQQGYIDYSLSKLEQMIGCCGRHGSHSRYSCVLYCARSKREFYKKFLYEAPPVESHLDHYLGDHLNAEVINQTIESLQDAVDFLTETFLYRRLEKNPNYYGLTGAGHRDISEHLSELVEGVVEELVSGECIEIEEDNEIVPLNNGMIAAFYSVRCATVSYLSEYIQESTRVKGLLRLLTSTPELEDAPVHQGEEKALRILSRSVPLQVPSNDPENTVYYNEPSTKVHLLIQAHLSRISLGGDVSEQSEKLLSRVLHLLRASVDVSSSKGYLIPALSAMELTQMIVQAVWEEDGQLLQIPNFTPEIVERCKRAGVEGIFDIMEMDDEIRQDTLRLTSNALRDVAEFCNQYPNVEVEFKVRNEADQEEVPSGSLIEVDVKLDREVDEDVDMNQPLVYSAITHLNTKERVEGWWLLVGDTHSRRLLAVKRIQLDKPVFQTKLQFEAPDPGEYRLTLYLMCDSYLGCDQEFQFNLHVGESKDMEDE